MLKYFIGFLILLALLRFIKASMKLIIGLCITAVLLFLIIQFGVLGALGL